MDVSAGHAGGHGSMRLHPDTVILPDGSRFRLYAQLTGTPGSATRVGSEGQIGPGSRLKHDCIEYGGAVGAGVVDRSSSRRSRRRLSWNRDRRRCDYGSSARQSHPQAVWKTAPYCCSRLLSRSSLVPAGATGS